MGSAAEAKASLDATVTVYKDRGESAALPISDANKSKSMSLLRPIVSSRTSNAQRQRILRERDTTYISRPSISNRLVKTSSAIRMICLGNTK